MKPPMLMLLLLAPAPSGRADDLGAEWLGLLSDSGALDALERGDTTVKAAAWLTRILDALSPTFRHGQEEPVGLPPRLFEIARSRRRPPGSCPCGMAGLRPATGRPARPW